VAAGGAPAIVGSRSTSVRVAANHSWHRSRHNVPSNARWALTACSIRLAGYRGSLRTASWPWPSSRRAAEATASRVSASALTPLSGLSTDTPNRSRPHWRCGASDRPVRTVKASAASLAVVAKMPCSCSVGNTPRPGLNPIRPHAAAGARTEPSPSMPWAMGARPAATAAAEPPLAPPGV
jgi:hypothetical protein